MDIGIVLEALMKPAVQNYPLQGFSNVKVHQSLLTSQIFVTKYQIVLNLMMNFPVPYIKQYAQKTVPVSCMQLLEYFYM